MHFCRKRLLHFSAIEAPPWRPCIHNNNVSPSQWEEEKMNWDQRKERFDTLAAPKAPIWRVFTPRSLSTSHSHARASVYPCLRSKQDYLLLALPYVTWLRRRKIEFAEATFDFRCSWIWEWFWESSGFNSGTMTQSRFFISTY